VAQKEIQSIEVSCFVHATEDEARVKDAVKAFFRIEKEPTDESLEGHFGNRIVHTTWHLTGEDAWRVFLRLVEVIGKDGRAEVLRDLASLTDDHGALYLRINKQCLMRGTALFSSSDPVRVRVKPRSFMMKGSPAQFYGRLLEAAVE
jgi:RNA-binding protein